MIIYRPQKGSLQESLAEKKEFNDENEMKRYLEKEWNGFIKFEDIVVYGDPVGDKRIGWKDVRYVCTNKFGEEDNLKKYGFPQCIGYCATDYK